ncbi:Polyphosphate kinase [Planctomycetes bacterium Pla163]|uniref:Polyphosphate kinase n=1 Tax=Rohdeia mirabilis TaxID=2528008 RepID=A0A518D029_9BACT|nr:Polyphosphate kinase [Planctomycetes bacterium Pla163]
MDTFAPMDSPERTDPNVDLDAPEFYFNRDLSLVEFNRRVLEQAKDPRVPLLERLRFLSISSTNLDEFFEIRVSGVKQQIELGATRPPGPDGRYPRELLKALSDACQELVGEQYRVLNNVILTELAEHGIELMARAEWGADLSEWVRCYFAAQVQPVLTPIGIDPSHPFPQILNKSLNFIVELDGTDAFGRHGGIGIVNVPRSLPRVIEVPEEVAGRPNVFVLLSSVIHAHVDELFHGMRVGSCHQFRVTRNSDLWVDEEEVDDLLRALKGELPRRKYGDAVRLEVAATCPQRIVDFLLSEFRLDERDLYAVDGPVNLGRLGQVYSAVDRPDLKYRPFVPATPQGLEVESDVFKTLSSRSVVLHHPYESFAPVIELLRRAARDPQVLAIKQVLYRTGSESAIVEALIDAALAGKEVSVVVELRARFDEQENIDLATRMQEAGVNVVYGIVGYKTHAKLLLIVRREDGGVRRYCHLGTGNYHPGTARAYTDLGLLTSDPEIGNDVHQIFTQLTGLGKVQPSTRIVQAPFHLHEFMVERIRAEAERARKGETAWIKAKMNALTEASIIHELYAASRAGVEIDLIVRGACCLRPGVEGVSDRIRVRSVVGRFLEHHRVFAFGNGGEPAVFAASADFMSRNFFRRVETCFPLLDRELAARVLRECLDLFLEDDQQSWLLQPDGSYVRSRAENAGPSAQAVLLEELAGVVERAI